MTYKVSSGTRSLAHPLTLYVSQNYGDVDKKFEQQNDVNLWQIGTGGGMCIIGMCFSTFVNDITILPFIIKPHEVHEMWTIVIDDPDVCLSVMWGTVIRKDRCPTWGPKKHCIRHKS